MRYRYIAVAVCLAAMCPSIAPAQHLFLDTDGDARASNADALRPTGATSISLFLVTDRNLDGSIARAASPGSRPLTVNSYEFIVRAVGGEVEWGEYTNLQPTMDVPFGPKSNKTDYYHGFGGMDALPPGKYKLGTLSVRVKSGRPKLELAATSPLWGGARTSFGSQCEGKDGDNTIKFTDERKDLGSPVHDVPGDWSDAVGIETASAGQMAASSAGASKSFSVTVSPLPANPSATISIRTVREGPLRVQVFDVSGRLVATLVDRSSAPGGEHTVVLGGALPSGVLLYRVEAADGLRTGKLVFVK